MEKEQNCLKEDTKIKYTKMTRVSNLKYTSVLSNKGSFMMDLWHALLYQFQSISAKPRVVYICQICERLKSQ